MSGTRVLREEYGTGCGVSKGWDNACSGTPSAAHSKNVSGRKEPSLFDIA